MSNDDPSVVKYIITSDEYDRLKHFEVKCQELFEEIKSLKELQSNAQTGKGDYIVIDNDVKDFNSVTKIVPNNEKPLINFSVPLIKNDENDDFDEQSLIYLVPSEHKSNAKVLLEELKQRGNELTWNSSGIVFVNQVSIPNSNMFYLFPYLFFKNFPVKKVEGLFEVESKLREMGLTKYVLINNANQSSTDNTKGRGEQDLLAISDREQLGETFKWYFIGLEVKKSYFSFFF